MTRLRLFIFSLALLSLSALADRNSESVGLLNQTLYVCPMHSHIVRDHAGRCPICGMDLVARPQQHSDARHVDVSGAMQQAMALTTEAAQQSLLWRFIKTYGSVQFDETGLMHLHPRTSGWIEKLYVNSVGQPVNKGDLLYEIYAPELLVAQEEFLSLLKESNRPQGLLQRGVQRLRLLGFNQKLIAQLTETRQVFYFVPYYAEQAGVVSFLDVREGMYVEPNNRIVTLANLAKVWVVANVFENQINWVKEGQHLELDLPALDIYNIEGVVEFVYPTLDPVTRTLQVRLALKNSQQNLKPGMLANVRIFSGAVDVINIPVNALIQTEKHNHVFVQTDNGFFERRAVEIGLITNQRVEIRSGLDVGDKVVTSGQFLLDAEASLSNTVTVDSIHQPHH